MTDDYDVTKFLQDNNVTKGWCALIKENNLDDTLKSILKQLDDENSSVYSKDGYAPERNKIMRAFSYADPKDVKVAFVGTSPAAREGIANGLSFTSDTVEGAAKSPAITRFNEVSTNAGMTNLDHVEWSKDGVLMLNAALTIPSGEEKAAHILEHNNLWLPFMNGLLNAWVKHAAPSNKLYVVLLGFAHWWNKDSYTRNYAATLWDGLNIPAELKSKVYAFYTDHPTFPAPHDQAEYPFPKNMLLTEGVGPFKTIANAYPKIFKDCATSCIIS